ncbi:MAG: transglycosylase SLT domain-containing protein [candidate division KSB1 bacterium]|nr:transglycosylase SLT domain-containing protein [candidate division KSB1 bacterium]MDZ7367681.1 transglycosylase SLT domain-containing protein [candidate division KSB1 bacterium]MDZ7404804.1 transglycosylase SLT domain-containing protein [candidate division KSB1 bacterium]
MNLDPKTWRAARRALEQAIRLYIDDPNVAFIDLGFSAQQPFKAGLVIRIHRRHLPLEESIMSESPCAIDASQLGFAVEFVESKFRYHLRQQVSEIAPPSRPQLCGGLPLVNEAGRLFTLGGIVRDRRTKKEMVLSSWHVLAESWAAGEEALLDQPVSAEGKETTEVAAEYARCAIRAGLDAAVFRLRSKKLLLNHQEGIGAVTGVTLPLLGMPVIKSGAATGVTSGVITGILGYSMQRYANRKQLIGPFVCITPEEPNAPINAPGDSGAWWLERSSRRAVALHFAGSDNPSFGLAFSMPEVLHALDVKVVTEAPTVDPMEQIASPAVKPIKPAAVESKILKALSLNVLFTGRWVNHFALAVVFLTLSLATVVLLQRLSRMHQRQSAKINQLQRQARDIKFMMQTDSARQQQIRKIVMIINRFNPEMPSNLKLDLASEIYTMSLKYSQLDVDLICATITHESAHRWDPEAVSFAGAMGLMQLLPTTARELTSEEGIVWTSSEEILFNPIYNVRLGCRYLASLVGKYGVEPGLAAYNGGALQAKRWTNGGINHALLPRETACYVPAIMKLYKNYREMGL